MFLDVNLKSKIVDFLESNFSLNFIYIFGSYARGEGREDSDVDIAIHTDRIIDEYELYRLSGELSFIINKDIDLVDLKNISTVFAAQIVANREIILCKDENLREEYEIRVFKDYAKLNEERKVIIDSIKKEGTIYGNDVLYNKISIIERCIIRIREVYDNDPENLKDYTKQDSIILNIQRVVEACIDISMHIVSKKKLGIPQSSRDAFEVLNNNGIISDELLKKIKGMIGFRNIAVHNYQKLNLSVIEKVIENHLGDFEEFIYEVNKAI